MNTSVYEEVNQYMRGSRGENTQCGSENLMTKWWKLASYVDQNQSQPLDTEGEVSGRSSPDEPWK